MTSTNFNTRTQLSHIVHNGEYMYNNHQKIMKLLPVYIYISGNKVFFVSDNMELTGAFSNKDQYVDHLERFVGLYLKTQIPGVLGIFVKEKIMEYAVSGD